MLNKLYCMLGILIPFFGTSLGSLIVFFLNKKINKKFENLIIGFASGVMIAASIWSLIIPSVEMAENQKIISWIPVTIGFSFGIIFLILINKITIKFENNCKKLNMLAFSVTLHNIPEGMAVGVIFAGFLSGKSSITLAGAFLLSIGIAIQNIPEGAIISMPLKMRGISKSKSFILGVLSGIVEPIGGVITIFLTQFIVPILPYLLSFAAGAMIYVVVEELIPEMHNGSKSSSGVVGFMLGFLVMMILDITLG